MRCRIFSRHRNATSYQVFIAFNEEHNENHVEGPITGHYCTCKNGARTLGACSHVTAIIWYLGFARHDENTKYPSTSVLHNVNDARVVDYQNLIQVLE